MGSHILILCMTLLLSKKEEKKTFLLKQIINTLETYIEHS